MAAQEKAYVESLTKMYSEENKEQMLRMKQGSQNYKNDLLRQIDYLMSEKERV